MGIVWRAHDTVLDRKVAVREVVFPPTMAEEERRLAEARVLREARAAARLDHPGVVTLHDVVQDQGGIFIVMELVEAPTLAEVVRDQGPCRSRHKAVGHPCGFGEAGHVVARDSRRSVPAWRASHDSAWYSKY